MTAATSAAAPEDGWVTYRQNHFNDLQRDVVDPLRARIEENMERFDNIREALETAKQGTELITRTFSNLQNTTAGATQDDLQESIDQYNQYIQQRTGLINDTGDLRAMVEEVASAIKKVAADILNVETNHGGEEGMNKVIDDAKAQLSSLENDQSKLTAALTPLDQYFGNRFTRLDQSLNQTYTVLNNGGALGFAHSIVRGVGTSMHTGTPIEMEMPQWAKEKFGLSTAEEPGATPAGAAASVAAGSAEKKTNP